MYRADAGQRALLSGPLLLGTSGSRLGQSSGGTVPMKSRPTASRRFALMVVTAICVLVAVMYYTEGWRGLLRRRVVVPALRISDYEQWARFQFSVNFPNSKPLNWDIAVAAVKLYNEKPMGPFVLAVEPGQRGNDCSDFVACAVDEGLGVGARFRRAGAEHVHGENPRLFGAIVWVPGVPVQPGDIISVRHSPWYKPYKGACWHVGIIGSDGRVYDYTKLKRWPEARYGRTPFREFVRNCHSPGDVVVRRLAPQYRYRIRPLPQTEMSPASQPQP